VAGTGYLAGWLAGWRGCVPRRHLVGGGGEANYLKSGEIIPSLVDEKKKIRRKLGASHECKTLSKN